VSVAGLPDGAETFGAVVLACGAWTPRLLEGLGMRLPLIVERGYLQRFRSSSPPRLPVFDADGGYVASPRDGGVQISSGTELTTLTAKPHYGQYARALDRAAEALTLDGPATTDIAVGNRPTLPDSLPAIGAVEPVGGLWIAAGHQHVGLNTSAGTADLLAALIAGDRPPIDPKPFAYSRFAVSLAGGGSGARAPA